MQSQFKCHNWPNQDNLQKLQSGIWLPDLQVCKLLFYLIFKELSQTIVFSSYDYVEVRDGGSASSPIIDK